MTNKLTVFLDFVFHFLPVSWHKAYFRAYNGQYSDNPKYVSMKLHEMEPTVKIYWEISDASKKNDIPQYVNIVKQGSIKQVLVKNRCRYIVETGMGYYLDYQPQKLVNQIRRILLHNKKQFNLSTWHGTPIKCIGAQIEGFEGWNNKNLITTSNGVLCGSTYLKKIFEKAFVGVCPILELGTPRTDILFSNTEEQKNKIKEKLGIPVSKKVILYAPTFRKSIEDSGVKQLEQINLQELLFALHSKFGGDWMFVMRAHPLVQNSVNELLDKTNNNKEFLSGNKYEDMMEYLSVSDILLTDFSSSVFDYVLTDRPCFMFAHDRNEYEANDRGIYKQMSFLPYHFSDTFQDLLLAIKEYDYSSAEEKRRAFLKEIGNIEDGNASEKAVNYLLSH